MGQKEGCNGGRNELGAERGIAVGFTRLCRGRSLRKRRARCAALPTSVPPDITAVFGVNQIPRRRCEASPEYYF